LLALQNLSAENAEKQSHAEKSQRTWKLASSAISLRVSSSACSALKRLSMFHAQYLRVRITIFTQPRQSVGELKAQLTLAQFHLTD